MKKAQIKRFVLYISGIIAVIIVVYITFFSVQIVSGVSEKELSPDTMLRVRVLGAGVTDVKAVAEKLASFSDTDIAVHVVETGTFDLHKVNRSFIIAHTDDKTPAIQLARQLHLDPSAVIYKPLEHNTKQITATLVAGTDMNDSTTNTQSKKE